VEFHTIVDPNYNVFSALMSYLFRLYFYISTCLQFFGFISMIVYGVDAFLKFKGWRAGEIAQGERVRSVQKSETVGTPAY
jgi:hypothetical protein